ncbi:glycosyltransferase family protein [Aeromonas sobria]|uniref:glycosyltransferase family protein n=1 Tax=Aeromonas sobria TaxID=646 RepID=UPI003F376F0C
MARRKNSNRITRTEKHNKQLNEINKSEENNVVSEFLFTEKDNDIKNQRLIISELNDKIKILQTNLIEAQKYRSGHWDKYQHEKNEHEKTKKIANANKSELSDILTAEKDQTIEKKDSIISDLNQKIKILKTELVEAQQYRTGHWAKYQYEKNAHEKTKINADANQSEINKIKSNELYTISRRLNNTRSLWKKIKYIVEIIRYKKTSSDETEKKYSPLLEVRQEVRQEVIHQDNNKLNVAVIMDEFSFSCFKGEFNAIVIEPSDWLEIFKNHKIDLFLCESAWSGVDSNRRPWKGRIYASKNFKSENRKELIEIIKFCNENNIPTAFWNKEDPTHYSDRTHDFVKTALMFDSIFTTAEECVELYKKEYGHKHVFCLPFATQPKLFNPISNMKRGNEVVFAGSWYENHTERCKDMRLCFDSILEADFDLKIYDRFYGGDDPLHIYPDKYSNYINKAVPFSEVDKVYKSSWYGLTINTVKTSNSMLARRAFELASCGTAIITNSSNALDSYFRGNYINLEKNPDALKKITRNDVDKVIESAMYDVLREHTYKNRFREIALKTGLSCHETRDDITFVHLFNSKSELCSAIASYNKSRKVHNKTKLLLIASTLIDDVDVQNYILEYNKDNINVIAESYIRNYQLAPSEILETNYFAVINNYPELTGDEILDKTLHYSYLDNEIIKLVDENSFIFTTNEIKEDIIGKKECFSSVFLNEQNNLKYYRVKA